MKRLLTLFIIFSSSALISCAGNPADTGEHQAVPGDQLEKDNAETPADNTPMADPEKNPSQDPVDNPVDDPVTEPNTQPRTKGIEPNHGQLNPGQQVDLLPPPDSEPYVRPKRRMTIKQLDTAITKVTGGISWTEGTGNKETNLFSKLGATLGVPDYIQVVQQDLSPGAVFQKFVGDAARSVCTKLVDKDLAGPSDAKVLMPYVTEEDTIQSAPEAVDKNLIYLLLRYHGYQTDPTDSALNSWRWLFESATHVTKQTTEAWRAVCIGLITHPNFYSY